MTFAVVGEFTRGGVVMNEQPETRTLTASRPLEHLEVAVGIAESGDRAAANVLVDADRLAGAIVDEIQIGIFTIAGPPSRSSYFALMLEPIERLGVHLLVNCFHALARRQQAWRGRREGD